MTATDIQLQSKLLKQLLTTPWRQLQASNDWNGHSQDASVFAYWLRHCSAATLLQHVDMVLDIMAACTQSKMDIELRIAMLRLAEEVLTQHTDAVSACCFSYR